MQDQVITIRTLECDICDRYDSINLSLDEVEARTRSTDLGIGAYSIVHKSHTRIVYFDKMGTYLGDTIAMNSDDIPENLQSPPLPFYIKNSTSNSTFSKMRRRLFSFLHRKNLVISIAGPSRAGKTSFVRYLDTLVPERDNHHVSSVPTMGRSTKNIKIGNSLIRSLDLGGQEDFWDMWKPAIDDSDAVIFILDATSNDVLEISRAFERVINYRKGNIPVLVILNKKDLILRGEASKFMSSGEFLSLSNLKMPIENVLSIEASIFEGKVYESKNLEEIQLADVISSFLSEHC